MLVNLQRPLTAVVVASLSYAVAGKPVPDTVIAERALYPSVSGYNYYGCYVEKYGSEWRTLGTKSTSYSGMTLETCARDCAGFTFFGIEYGQEVCNFPSRSGVCLCLTRPVLLRPILV